MKKPLKKEIKKEILSERGKESFKTSSAKGVFEKEKKKHEKFDKKQEDPKRLNKFGMERGKKQMYIILEPIRVKKQGHEIELKTGHMIALPQDKATLLLEQGKVRPLDPKNLTIGTVPDEPGTAWLKREAEKKDFEHIVFDVKPCPNEKYLTLAIDTDKARDRRYIIHSLIDTELDKYLKGKGKEIRKPKRIVSAEGETTALKEGKRIYNLHHDKNKTFAQIAEEIYKTDSNSYDGKLKKAKRRYDKYRKEVLE